AFADEDDLAPPARGPDGRTARLLAARTLPRPLDAVPARERAHRRDVVRPGEEHVVAQAERAGQVKPVVVHVEADDARGAEGAREHGGGEPDGAEAGDEHDVVAADADFLQALVDGAEAAG